MAEVLFHPDNQLILTLVILTIYFLPTLIGATRGHHKMVWIFLVNLFVGWTGAGWIFLLGYSCFSNKH